MNGSCSDTELIFILLALTLFFTTQSKQSHHLESYLDSSSEYNALTTFKLPYGNTTTSFTPRHTITGKGIAYVKPFDTTLPLGPTEIEFENNRCCIEIHNTSNSTVEFLYRQEMAYFDARSKGLVQTNNSKHFPIDQYLHDRMTPATLSPTPLAYEKPITQQKCHV